MEWISVEDRLPKGYTYVLVHIKEKDGSPVTVGWYSSEWGWAGYDSYGTNDLEVTHWMPLPEVPDGVSI